MLNKKQKKKKKQCATQKSIIPRAISELPVTDAWESEMIQGIQMGCFIRCVNSNDYHLMMFLLDTWALGIKDSYLRRLSYEGYERAIEGAPQFHRVEAGQLKLLVQDTATFGKKNGIEPIGSYKKMLPFMANIDSHDSEPHSVEFGKDGRVVYVANSENETPKEIKNRLASLEKTLGHDNFSYYKT